MKRDKCDYTKFYSCFRQIVSIAVLAVCLAGVFACQRASLHYAPRLLTIEKSVVEQPSEALRQLVAERKTITHTPADSALYNLLFYESLYRLGTFSQSDELQYAEQMFLRIGDKERLYRTKLQRAAMAVHRRDAQQAMILLLELNDFASKSGSYAWRYEVDYLTGCVYKMAHAPQDAYVSFQKALDLGENGADSLHLRNTAQTVNAMAEMLLVQHKTMEAKALLHRYPIGTSDEELQSDRLVIYSFIAERMHQTSHARSYAMQAYQCFPTGKATIRLAEQKEREGEVRQANSLWQSVVNDPDNDVRLAALRHLALSHQRMGQWATAAELALQLCDEYRVMEQTNLPVTVVQMQSDHARMKQEVTYFKRWVIFASIVAAVLVLLLIFVLYYHRKAQRMADAIDRINERYAEDLHRLKETQLALEHLQSSYDVDARDLYKAKEELAVLRSRIASYQEDKASPETWVVSPLMVGHEVTMRMHFLAAKGQQPMVEDWHQLMDVAAKLDALFMQWIAAQAALSDADLRVCLLTRLRFLPSEMGNLLLLTPQAITNRRKRLYERLTGKAGGAKDFDAFMQRWH